MDYDRFCIRCQHYDFNLDQGTLCSLTHSKPSFEEECTQYVLDPERDKRLTMRTEKKKKYVMFYLKEDLRNIKPKHILLALWIVFVVVFFIKYPGSGRGGMGPSSFDRFISSLDSKTKTDNDLRIKAPDFTLMTLDGEEVNLKDFRGKVLLINFWATWCAPCRVEIPDLVKLKSKHGKEGFDVLAITARSGTPDDIAKFAEKFKMNYWVLTSEREGDIRHVVDLYGKAGGVPIQGIPTTFLVDREGYIRQLYIGPRSEAQFWQEIQLYL